MPEQPFTGRYVNIPSPDPSTLTNEAIHETIQGLKELLGARLDAMDAATEGRMEMYYRALANVDVKIGHLKDVQEEKFSGIRQQFVERDVRTEQASSSADDALKAALQAAKELVGAQGEASAAAAVKSETSFTKQIDQIGALIQTGNAASDARITELKERIDRGEGSAAGTRETVETRRSDSSLMVSAIAAMIVLFSVVTTVVIAVMK